MLYEFNQALNMVEMGKNKVLEHKIAYPFRYLMLENAVIYNQRYKYTTV